MHVTIAHSVKQLLRRSARSELTSQTILPIAKKNVLSAFYPNALHVLCITHIVNLVSEVFHYHSDFKHTYDLIAMIKSSLFKKPGRKSRLKFLAITLLVLR